MVVVTDTVVIPEFDVRRYGMVDPTGVIDSTAAFQAAITAAALGTVVVPPGTFVCGSLTPHSGLRFMGSGKGITIIKALAGAHTLFDTSTFYLTDVEVCDLTYDGTNQTAGQPGIEFVLGSRIAVRRCRIIKTTAVGLEFYIGTECVAEDNDIESAVSDGIRLGGSPNTNCRIINNKVLNSGGIGINGQGTGTIVSGNTVAGSGTIGIAMSGSVSNTVADNVVTTSADNGIDIGQSFHMTVIGNTVNGALSGLDMDMAGAAAGTYCGNSFVANTLLACTDAGITLTSNNGVVGCVVQGNTIDTPTSGGIWLTNIGRTVVNGNVVYNSPNGVALTGASHLTVSENEFLDDRGGSSVLVAVHYNSGCSYNTFTGNDFSLVHAITSGGIPATDIYRGNPGYNPVGHAVAQPVVPSTTVAATNTTNVDCTVFVNGGTVTVVAIGGSTTGQVAGAFRVPAGQTITLTYSIAPTWQWFGD